MFRLIGLMLLCVFASANSALLGAKECTYGPSFWCASLQNAKTCRAVRHCISSVWEKQILPKDTGDICNICKHMVDEARKQLESEENQKLLKQVFEGTCRLLPMEQLRTECITYVDEFIPELIETLASEMQPQVVCATVGLCNAAISNNILRKYEGTKKVDNSPSLPNDCVDCQTFIQDMKKMVLSYSREELMNKMMQVCGRFSSLADGCKTLVQINFEEMYDYLENKLDAKQACEMFGFCDRIYGGHETKLLHKTGDEICDFCESVVQHYKDNLSSNTSKAQFKEILVGMCKSTGHFRHECLSLVNQYYEIIYDLLISEVDAQKICEAIGLCGKSSVFQKDVPNWTLFLPTNSQPLFPRLPLIPLEGNGIGFGGSHFAIKIPRSDPSTNNIKIISLANTGRLTPKMKRKADECYMCEFVLHLLQNFLQENHTRTEIKDALSDVCSWMPHTLSERCQDYIDAYGDQLLEFLIYEMDPSVVCPMMNLCPGESKALSSVNNKDICLVCEYVMKVVDETMSSHVMYIEKTIKVVCDLFPPSIRSSCDNFVDEYGRAIINYLEAEVSPKEICLLMKFCHTPNTSHGKKYGKRIPNMLHFNHAKGYSGINYATQLLQKISKPVVKNTELVFTQSMKCVLCEFIMHELDHFLLFPATRVKIESALERVCLIIPSRLQTDCLTFLEKYTSVIVDLLLADMDPTVVCTKGKICRNTIIAEMPAATVSFVKRDLLGKDKCTWGPAYWCKSEWHASSCHATKHCVEKVWKNGKPLI